MRLGSRRARLGSRRARRAAALVVALPALVMVSNGPSPASSAPPTVATRAPSGVVPATRTSDGAEVFFQMFSEQSCYFTDFVVRGGSVVLVLPVRGCRRRYSC
jgi:hypothetical protein